MGNLMRADRRWGVIYSQGSLTVPERSSPCALETEGLYKDRSQGVINVVLLWQCQAENITHLLSVSMAPRHTGIGEP